MPVSVWTLGNLAIFTIFSVYSLKYTHFLHVKHINGTLLNFYATKCVCQYLPLIRPISEIVHKTVDCNFYLST